MRLPFTNLDRQHWERLADAGMLTALLCFLAYVGLETFLVRGVDFRGYYAAASVALHGGDPYDYHLVSEALLESTGEMGNNPYYYPPWFCLFILPLALVPFRIARAVWIGLTLLVYWFGARLAFSVLNWEIQGWRRSLVMLSGAYLFLWMSMRSEQLGTWLLFLAVLSLWGYQQGRPGVAGAALALLLTKPNVTWLTVPFLGLFYLRHQRRAVLWALLVLIGLLAASTLIFPSWFSHLADPSFGAGLKYELDGPDQIKSGRMNTVLSDWLGQWGVAPPALWLVWSGLALGSGVVFLMAWRQETDMVYRTALASALGLLLTPYALQYDYPPLILALFWIWMNWGKAKGFMGWVALTTLIFIFSVPFWEHPVYDGYWILLGIVLLLLVLNTRLWQWFPQKSAEASGPGQ